MLLSARRTVIATCGIVLCILLVIFSQHRAPAPLIPPIAPVTPSLFSGLAPHWTTEQLEPRFAYVQYATDVNYLCNSIINFGLLVRYGAQYDKVLVFPKQWENDATSREHRILNRIRIKYAHLNLKFHPVDMLSTSAGDPTWRNSLTKFQAFGMTAYTRALVFDSDSLVLNNMDHYFLSPLAPVAVPRAYWLTDPSVKTQILSSHVMLIAPNAGNYNRILADAQSSGDFDMEVLNRLFGDSAMILPHRRLALLTGEFRNKDHTHKLYMAEDPDEEWNAMAEVSRACLVHFSDWPLPKPWLPHTDEQWNSALPECLEGDKETPDKPKCADVFMWTGIYEDYHREKDQVCGPLLDV